jgi:CBS domain-containing protein
MKVRDIMTSEGLATATLDTTLTEIAQRMRDENVGAIPIVDDEEKLAGIITDRDIVVRAIAEGDNPEECTAEEILSEELHTIHPEADLEEAADLMASHQIRRLPVLEDDVIVGMISLGDLAVKAEEDQASDALEEISEGVREITGTRSRTAQPRSQPRQSPGERVAEEETQYQRHSGGTRAESALAGRTRNQSKSQQTIANELVNAEGEEEPQFQNAGGGNPRQRGNQQQPSVRGRQSESARGRSTAPRRGVAVRRPETQGASNRSERQEKQRQQKVAPMRAEASNPARERGKRKAG